MVKYEDFCVSAETLRDLINDERLLLLDVRHHLKDPNEGRRLYEAGHIAGARFADMAQDVAGHCTGTNGRNPFPVMAEFAERMRRLGVNDNSFIVIYDQDKCNFAARLWFTLRYAGHENVRILDGGLAAWVKAGGEVTTEVPSIVPGDMSVKAPKERVFTVEEIEANLVTKEFVTVDARGKGRYLGEGENLDGSGGHIPGALSRPSTENLNEAGVLKSAEALRADFDRALAKAAGKPIVNSCGSGVTACFNHLSMKLAGLEPLGVYIGSWSEWIKGDRPISTEDETL